VLINSSVEMRLLLLLAVSWVVTEAQDSFRTGIID